MAKYIGDRPAWQLTNQRWDNPDPHLISTLVNQTLVRMWGNLVGPTWGCLTRPTLDTTNYLVDHRIAIGKCVFGYAWNSLERGEFDLEGGPVIYDPDRAIQSLSTVYVDPTWENDTNGVWLWFKRNEGAAATDMRAYRPTATEEVAATPTEYDEWVDFVALPTQQMPHATINEDQGWFRFARIPTDGGWSAGVPQVELISFWDGWYLQQTNEYGINGTNTFGQFMFDPPTAAASDNTRHGLAQVLQSILNQLAILLDSNNLRDNETDSNNGNVTESTAWHERPARGINQLGADLAALEAADLDTRLTAVEADTATLKSIHPIYACSISRTNVVSNERYGTPSSPLLSTVYGGGICTITFDAGLGAGLKVDYTSIPQVTARDRSRRLNAYWDSQYVLLVKSFAWDGDDPDTDMYNSDFYLTITGSYV